MIEKIIYFISGTPAYAETAEELLRVNDRTVAQTGDVFTLVDSILARIPYILGAMAFLAIIYSGFLYVMALGDPTKMESAKKNIYWVFTGILAIAVILIVMQVIVKITGSGALSGSNAPF